MSNLIPICINQILKTSSRKKWHRGIPLDQKPPNFHSEAFSEAGMRHKFTSIKSDKGQILHFPRYGRTVNLLSFPLLNFHLFFILYALSSTLQNHEEYNDDAYKEKIKERKRAWSKKTRRGCCDAVGYKLHRGLLILT